MAKRFNVMMEKGVFSEQQKGFLGQVTGFGWKHVRVSDKEVGSTSASKNNRLE